MKTIFITGASSGIGKETTKFFSDKGWRVIATMRNLEKGKDLAKLPGVVIKKLDVTNSTQIKTVCQETLAEYDVDVLFNNAGYGMMAPLERLPEDGIRKLFDTDVFGTIFVTQQFIPYFKKRKSGIILTTTSLAAIIALPRDGVYGAAKRAQQSMMETLYYELKPYGVAAKILIPGGTKTNFQTPINDREGYEEPAKHQNDYLLDGNEEFPGPEEAAQTVWEAVTDGKDTVCYPADRVCKKLYNEYTSMDYEEFKKQFYHRLFEA